MSRALVTGATGRVGSAVVNSLADREASPAVRAGVRNPEGAAEEFGEDTAVVAFDFARPETWGPALEGVDALFLMFPPTVGVDPVREFADAADRVGVERVAFLSVLGADAVPVLPHRRIERHLAGRGFETAFLRAAYFVQNLADIHRAEIVERDQLFVPAGDGALGFVDARDVGAVAAKVLTGDVPARRGGVASDLTGPESLDFHEVAAVFSDVLEREIEYADPGRIEFARHMLDRGVTLGMVLFMLAEYEVTRRGRSGRTTEELAQLLGMEPTTVREFVAEHRERFAPA